MVNLNAVGSLNQNRSGLDMVGDTAHKAMPGQIYQLRTRTDGYAQQPLPFHLEQHSQIGGWPSSPISKSIMSKECVREEVLPHWSEIAPVLATLCQLTGVGSTYIPQDRRHHPTSFWNLHRVHGCQSGFRYRQRVCPYPIPVSLTTNRYYNPWL